jgi:hypothetical protein
LKIPVDAFKNFDEEQGINNIVANTFNEVANFADHSSTFNINPVEKWLKALEENKKLYERMIKEKDDMIFTLQAMLENMKK